MAAPRTARAPVPLAQALGRRVKLLRHQANKSQEELAFDAHVDRTYISAVERGAANPSVETLANICYGLGVTLAFLFEALDDVSLAPTGLRRSNAASPLAVKRSRLR